jgi:hypothetical protein
LAQASPRLRWTSVTVVGVPFPYAALSSFRSTRFTKDWYYWHPGEKFRPLIETIVKDGYDGQRAEPAALSFAGNHRGRPRVKKAELIRTGRTGQLLLVDIHSNEIPVAAVGTYERIEQYLIAVMSATKEKATPLGPPSFGRCST